MPIYGTRPEAIKMAPVVRLLEAAAEFECIVTVTGQHREMLDQVNDVFGVEPRHDLNVIQPRQTLTEITSKVLDGVSALLSSERPDLVMVQGDTTSAMAGALAAFYHGIPVVHLEAGLRTHDLAFPFPEEGNRKIIGQLARLHLAPTAISRSNLIGEGVPPSSIAVTGNTVIDALHLALQAPFSGFDDPVLQDMVLGHREILLVTTHRRENLGDGMRSIAEAVRRVAMANPELVVVLPIHRNPAVRETVVPVLRDIGNVHITEPLQYLEFANLLSASKVVLTDSGGIQEEAPALGKPVLVMRDTTERPEAVTAGVAKLVGTDSGRIECAVSELLCDSNKYDQMARAVNPYGDGAAAERSVAGIRAALGIGEPLPDFAVSVDLGAGTSPAQA